MAYSPRFSNPFGFVLTPWVKRLIIANVAAFVVITALELAGFRGLRNYLAFSPREIHRVWTIVTYMFVHLGVLHLLINMLMLLFFGPRLEERWGSREFLKFYVIVGMGGAILSLLFPSYPIAGASGAVFGVLVAFAMYWPDTPIYIWGIFPVKAKWLVGFFVGLNAFYWLTGGQAGIAHLAHLGGAITAFAYLKSPWAPPAWGNVPRKPRDGRWTHFFASLIKPPPKKAPESKTPVASASRKRELHRAFDDVDRILEKISAAGMSSLTDDEKRKLEEASRKFRTN